MRTGIAPNPAKAIPELQPPCPTCGNPMWLMRLSSYSDTEELRTFKCQVCERTETKIIKSP